MSTTRVSLFIMPMNNCGVIFVPVLHFKVLTYYTFSVSPILVSLLWDTLTGREHLLFYGRLKNLSGAALSEVRKYNHQLHFNICLNKAKTKECLRWFSYIFICLEVLYFER